MQLKCICGKVIKGSSEVHLNAITNQHMIGNYHINCMKAIKEARKNDKN